MSVDAYIQDAPEEHRALLNWLRNQIRQSFPDATESVDFKAPVYKIGDNYKAGFAWRNKGVMFYTMKPDILDRYAERLGRNRSGKACVLLTPNKRLSDSDLRAITLEILEEMKAH
jgi:uncharacterized protein YdhG (YjbR/CyaY superfamily)